MHPKGAVQLRYGLQYDGPRIMLPCSRWGFQNGQGARAKYMHRFRILQGSKLNDGWPACLLVLFHRWFLWTCFGFVSFHYGLVQHPLSLCHTAQVAPTLEPAASVNLEYLLLALKVRKTARREPLFSLDPVDPKNLENCLLFQQFWGFGRFGSVVNSCCSMWESQGWRPNCYV